MATTYSSRRLANFEQAYAAIKTGQATQQTQPSDQGHAQPPDPGHGYQPHPYMEPKKCSTAGCGRMNRGDARFCDQCGHSLQEAQQRHQEGQQGPPPPPQQQAPPPQQAPAGKPKQAPPAGPGPSKNTSPKPGAKKGADADWAWVAATADDPAVRLNAQEQLRKAEVPATLTKRATATRSDDPRANAHQCPTCGGGNVVNAAVCRHCSFRLRY